MTTLYRQRGPKVNRRRALTILAGAGALLMPGYSRASTAKPFRWNGTALGADASIVLYHQDIAIAQEAVSACLQEIERLENEFSLYRAHSAINRLNNNGVLQTPSHDMRLLLRAAKRFGDLSHGAFDVTLQSLWRLYADYFSKHPTDSAGPAQDMIDEALRVVDYHKISMTPDRITLAPGATISLNGIAQGYITDRVAELLRRRGWSNVMINLGEMRALDNHPDGRPWRIGMRGVDGGNPDKTTVLLDNQALATSGGYGTPFDETGRVHHLIDPRSGRSVNRYKSVSVIARDAMTADALSTALYVSNQDEARELIQSAKPHRVAMTFQDGQDSKTEWIKG